MTLARQNEPEETSASKVAKKLSDTALAKRVVSGFCKIKTELPYIIELRSRFRDLPRGKANIDGCRTWTEFCNRRLFRSDRQVRALIAEALEPEPEASVVQVQVRTTNYTPSTVHYVRPTPTEPTRTIIPVYPAKEETETRTIIPVYPDRKQKAAVFLCQVLSAFECVEYGKIPAESVHALIVEAEDGNEERLYEFLAWIDRMPRSDKKYERFK
jgi:hypothetical protein